MRNVDLPTAATAVSDSRDVIALQSQRGGSEKRRSPRIAIRLPGLISWREGQTERIEAAFTTSVNRFGCALHCHTFFQPGTRLSLDFGDKTIRGHVVHSLKDHSVNLVTIGVAFDQDANEFWPVGFELGR